MEKEPGGREKEGESDQEALEPFEVPDDADEPAPELLPPEEEAAPEEDEAEEADASFFAASL